MFFMTSEGQLFCRISFNMDLSGVFLWLDLFFGKNTGKWCCVLFSPSYQGVWWGNIYKIFSQSKNPLWCEFSVFSSGFWPIIIQFVRVLCIVRLLVFCGYMLQIFPSTLLCFDSAYDVFLVMEKDFLFLCSKIHFLYWIHN